MVDKSLDEKSDAPDTEFVDDVVDPDGRHGPIATTPDKLRGLPHAVVGYDGTPSAAATIPQPPPPPDGGRAAWTQAAMGHLVMFNTWGFISSFGLFESYYATDLLSSSSQSSISLIGSVQCFLVFAIGLFSGRALDTGHFRLVYTSGCILVVLGIMTLSVCQTYWQVFLAQALCVGLGTGLMFTPSLSLVATYFSSMRIWAICIFLCGAGTGGMIMPGIFTSLLPKIGFGWTVRILAFLIMAVSAITLAFLRPRNLAKAKDVAPLFDKKALRDPVFLFFTGGMWLVFLALYFAFFFLGTFSSTVIGLSYSSSVDLLIALNGIGIPGRLIPAYIATSYTGAINTLTAATVMTAICLYSWIAVRDTTGLYCFAIFYGFFSSALQGLWPAALANLTEDISALGSRMGVAFTFISTALITGPPIGGALVNLDHGGFLCAQIWTGSCFACGVVLLVLARVHKTGRRLRVKI